MIRQASTILDFATPGQGFTEITAAVGGWVAETGIADAGAGRLVTIATPEDAVALHERTMTRLHARMAADQG